MDFKLFQEVERQAQMQVIRNQRVKNANTDEQQSVIDLHIEQMSSNHFDKSCELNARSMLMSP